MTLDREGKSFKIEKEIRQGDLLSSDLSNSVVQTIMNLVDSHKKSYGIQINGKNFTNLRFTDVIILFATTN